jgi:uncharacterized protein (DUF1499 family)
VKIVLILIAAFVGLQVAVRFWPLPDTPWRVAGMAIGVSEFIAFGGYYARSESVSFSRLKDRISATPRVKIIKDDQNMVAVYNSWFWGFPDVIEVWEDMGVVHISGHSVIGSWDMGSNKKRIQTWLDN